MRVGDFRLVRRAFWSNDRPCTPVVLPTEIDDIDDVEGDLVVVSVRDE